MINPRYILLFLSQCSLLLVPFQVNSINDKAFRHPFYVGGIGGYGSTTWQGLVPTTYDELQALSISVPIEAKEGGAAWGIYTGYEFSPFFAVEASYMHYPDATIYVDPDSFYSVENENITQFNSRTSTVSLMAKLMIIIPNTTIRAYSGIGASNIHRADLLKDDWLIGPAFSAGFNYHLTEHIMAELGGNYTTGYGESTRRPANNYFPFLYSVAFRLAYCI